MAKNLKGYKENHIPIINRFKQWIFGKFGRFSRIWLGYSFLTQPGEMGNPGWAGYFKTNSPNIFQTKGDDVEKVLRIVI